MYSGAWKKWITTKNRPFCKYFVLRTSKNGNNGSSVSTVKNKLFVADSE